MEVMRLREEPRQLTGRVEMDDAYLGGKPGRGSENKVPFIAAVLNFAGKSLARPTNVVSDGLRCFAVLASLGMVLKPTITGEGSASAKMPQFAAVNGFNPHIQSLAKKLGESLELHYESEQHASCP
jgi:hypothetical protein